MTGPAGVAYPSPVQIFHPAPWRVICRGTAAVALALAAGLAIAAPDEPADLVGQLLAARGLATEMPVVTPVVTPVLATPAAAVPGTGTGTGTDAEATKPGLFKAMHERAADMVLGAMTLLGVRYQRGGTSAETGFDCSGFTRHVFETSLGLLLPRRADEQAKAPGLVPVARADLQPGDLVFFNTLKRTFSHVGIYIGDHRFIHAPSTGKDVRVEDMGFAYWAKRFTGARRFEGPARGE